MAITTYENFVLENKATDILNTKLNVNALFTIDDSLATAAGLEKIIHKYTYTGEEEILEKGAKNSVYGSISYEEKRYRVKRHQHTFRYYDEDLMTDPYAIDTALNRGTDVMSNAIRKEYFDEIAKVENNFEYTTFNYDAIVDALAELNLEVENGLFVIMGNDLKAKIRKDKDFVASRQGEILYSGQFGTISGVPVCFSKLCPDNTAYISRKDAVTMFVKKNVSIEQDRDIESKENTVVMSRNGLMALTDETHSIKLTPKA